MTAALDQALLRIDERVDDLVELTRELIRFPTVNPPGASSPRTYSISKPCFIRRLPMYSAHGP